MNSLDTRDFAARSSHDPPAVQAYIDYPDTRSHRSRAGTPNAPDGNLSQISPNAMNALNGNAKFSIDHKKTSKSNSTIRSVPSDPLPLDTNPLSEAARRSQNRSESSVMPHSTQYSLPLIPSVSSNLTLTRQNSNSTILSAGSSVVRKVSSEFGPTRSLGTNNSLQIPEDSGSPDGNGIIRSPSNSSSQQWSSAVGRSTLGKSGRVIDKLQSEIDAMRRELTSERLTTAESKNQVILAESKLQTMGEEHAAALHDAAVQKTLLRRKERQVTDMKAQIEVEKQRADKAVEREQSWRDQMERIEAESKVKVEEAQMRAALMEGRNKTMTNHWREQGAEVDRTVMKLGKEIEKIVEERKADDNRMNMLRGLCDQQSEQLSSLQTDKEMIEGKFEEYKREQEQALKDIKAAAQAQQETYETKMREAQDVLKQLKWALNVKANVKDAQ